MDKKTIEQQMNEIKEILKSPVLEKRIRKVYEESLEELNYKLAMLEQQSRYTLLF